MKKVPLRVVKSQWALSYPFIIKVPNEYFDLTLGFRLHLSLLTTTTKIE